MKLGKQCQRVLNHLESFDSMTPMQAIEGYGITRLASVIYDLRGAGYDITTETVQSTNRFGDKVSYARYRLGDMA